MRRWTRKTRTWLAALGAVWIPLVINVIGLRGFWPVLAICAAGVLWTIWLFRTELSSLTMDVPPDERYQRPFWLVAPGIAALLFALYPFVRLYVFAVRSPQPLGFEDLLQTYIHDRAIYISDLARTGSVITGKTFERVTFVGPAIVALGPDSDFDHVTVDVSPAPPSSAFIPVEPKTWAVGIIQFRDCVCKYCTFKRIQLMGTPQQIEYWRKAVTSLNDKPISPGSFR